MRDNTIYISYSRASAYMTCPYKHHLGYVLGLQPKKPVRPLQFGTDFHKLLEHRSNPEALESALVEIKDTYYGLPSAWQEDLGRTYLEDLEVIFGDYCKVYRDALKPSVTEYRFEIDLGKRMGVPVVFTGIVDEIYKKRDKQTGEKFIRLGEHKTFSRRPDQSVLVMNTQKCLYAKAVNYEFGIMPRSVIWDYIHSSPADEPLWLEKSQRFSSTRSARITPYSWRRACKRYGITDKATRSRAAEFSGNISNYFFRYDMDIVPEMVNQVWDWFEYAVKGIVKLDYAPKNITRDCAWCSYKDICHAELTGASPDYIIEADFVVKEEKEAVSIASESQP